MDIMQKLKLINNFLLNGDYSNLNKLKDVLENELKIECNQKQNTLPEYKFVVNFIKKIDKTKTQFKGITPKNNKYYISDGFRAFEFLNKIEGIETVDPGIGYKSLFEIAKKLGVNKLEIENNVLIYRCKEHLSLKDNSPLSVECNNKIYYVNPNYILDIFKIIKNPIFYLSDNVYNQIYITSDTGKVNSILLTYKEN